MADDSQTRRRFIQATATVAAASSMTAVAESGHSGRARRTLTTDVLVCGGGCAGIAAALSLLIVRKFSSNS